MVPPGIAMSRDAARYERAPHRTPGNIQFRPSKILFSRRIHHFAFELPLQNENPV
jgi:hypothetical protein